MIQPSQIEKESMNFIDQNVNLKNFNQEQIPVVKRIIHATGDLEIANDIIFYGDAVKKGINAIKKRNNVITDVNMVKTGINEKRLASFGGKVFCEINESEAYKTAQKTGKTRAASAIESFENSLDNQLIAVGNAPTALFAILDMIKKKNIAPALIIGVPVGFIGAKESKEALLQVNIPAITIKGFKGGSPIACAVVNAILNMANEEIGMS